MGIPLLDLKREYALIEQELQAAWAGTLATMRLLKGENVAAFEREIAAYIGTPHACGNDSRWQRRAFGLGGRSVRQLDSQRHAGPERWRVLTESG